MVSEILFLSLFFNGFFGVCLAFLVWFVFACLVWGFVLDFVVAGVCLGFFCLVGFCCFV